MSPDELLSVLDAAADAVVSLFAEHAEWGLAETRPGQYLSDLASDEVVLAVLRDAGVGVLSEESGVEAAASAYTVVVDPLDGSTNASLRLPWYATSLCAVDDEGPAVAVVHHHGTGVRYRAVRDGGASRNGVPMPVPRQHALDETVVGVNGLPPASLGWWQFRAMGAAALDLCAVADGSLSAYVDFTTDSLGPWDYLGALLVCDEVGVPVVDVAGRDLCVLDHDARRTPLAAGSQELLDHLLSARAGVVPG